METLTSRSCRVTRPARFSCILNATRKILLSRSTPAAATPGTAIIATIAILSIFTCATTLHAQVWNREVADSTGNKQGEYCKIALDPMGNPVIAHVDGDFRDLVLLEKENGQWNRQVIDTSGYTGWSAGMAIDASGDLHLSFENGGLIYEPASTFGINYLARTQGVWTKTAIESYEILLPASSTHIALSSSGKPVVGYWKQGDEMYYLAFLNNDVWEKKKSPYPYTAINMLLTSDDKPVVLFSAGSSLVLAIYDATTDTWEDYTVPEQPLLYSAYREDVDFVLDQHDHVHLAGKFIDATTIPFFFLKYFHFDWVNWESATISATDTEYNNQVAVDNEGQPVILTIHNAEKHLVLYRQSGEDWTYETIDGECGKYECADMVFDEQNRARIVLMGKPDDIHSPRESMVLCYQFLTGLPQMNHHPESLNFGEVWTESSRILPVTISNSGEAPLIIGGYELSNTGILSLTGASFPVFIQPGDSLILYLEFAPPAQQSYTENLRLITNDPVHPAPDIPVTGTGIGSGTQATLELFVKNCYVDLNYKVIDSNDPLAEVKAGLYRGGSLVASEQFTDNTGSTVFTGLETGAYTMKLLCEADPAGKDIDCRMEQSITLGPGYNSIEKILPDSLFHYQSWLSDTLSALRLTGNDLAPVLGYEEAMQQVDALMQQEASDINYMHTEALARMILTEHMVRDMFEEGHGLGKEMFKDFGELIAFVFYSNDWATRLLDLLVSLVKAAFMQGGADEVFKEICEIIENELIKDAIYDQINEQVAMVASQVGYPASEAIIFAWLEVWNTYSSGWNFSFGTEEWGSIIMGVREILEAPFIQEVYVEALTSPSIEKGLSYTDDNWYNGTFYDAFMEEVDYVSDEKNSVGMALDAAGFFRVTAEMFMTTASIMNWIGAIPGFPYKDIIEQAAYYVKVAAYIEVITALTISTGKFFSIPSNMEGTVDNIFFPDGKPKKSAQEGIAPKTSTAGGQPLQIPATRRADRMQVSQMKSLLASSSDEYSTILETIRDKIISGDRMSAAADIPMLRTTEKAYNNSLMRTASPVMAVAARALEDLESFTPMWDSLKIRHATLGQDRFQLYFQLLLATGDTTGGSASGIAEQIDRQLNHLELLNETTTELLDTVTAHLEIPAVLSGTIVGADKTRLMANETGTVRITVMNTGAVAAENAYMEVTCNEAMEVAGPDSIPIGTLAPGEETGEIALKFTCSDAQFALGTWRMQLRAGNATGVLPCH